MSLNNALLNAISRYGPMVNQLARRQYGISGQALLAKLTQGESGGSATAKSPVGAYGYTQFMPSSRQIAVQKYGVDPWAGPNQAEHAAALHLLGKINGSTGLAGFNPGGGQGYVNYILGQKVGPLGGSGGAHGPSAGTQPGTTTQTTLSGSVTPGAVSGGGFNPGAPPDLTALLGQQSQPVAYQTPRPVTAGLKNLRMSVQSPQIEQLAPAQTTGPDLTSLLSAAGDLPATSVGAPKTQITRTQQQIASGGGGQTGPGLQLPANFQATHQTAGLPGFPARDIFAKPGTPVRAPVSGTIVKLSGRDPAAGAYQGQGGPFGWSIYVKGNDGVTYFLTHFGSRNVRIGQKIQRGQVIGTVGNYPGATPDHIHEGRKG